MLIYEAVQAQNHLLTYGGSTPANALLGFTPRDFFDLDSVSSVSYGGALEASPDTFEANVRMRAYQV